MPRSGIRELALGCLIAATDSEEPPQWLVDLTSEGLAGVSIFAHNHRSETGYTQFVDPLRAANPNLIVATDEEGGDVTRIHFEHGSPALSAAALGQLDDEVETLSTNAAIAADALAAGVNFNFAPCADLTPASPSWVLINRCFGRDPQLVARHIGASVNGMQEAGVAACAKHFPGHGTTSADSHLELPVVNIDLETLAQQDLVPFAAAVEAGVSAIMLAHLVVPAFGNQPTSQNPAVVASLRTELGFNGVVVTDALDMGAVADGSSFGQNAVASLRAGADLLCLGSKLKPEHIEEVVAEIESAVAGGQLPIERLAEAAGRVEVVADQYKIPQIASSIPTPDGAAQRIGRHVAFARGDVPPVQSGSIVECRPEPSAVNFDQRWSIAAALVDRIPGTTAQLIEAPEQFDQTSVDVPAAVIVNGAEVHTWQQEVVDAVRRVNQQAVVVEVGPHSVGPDAPSIVSYGWSKPSVNGIAAVLTGQSRGDES